MDHSPCNLRLGIASQEDVGRALAQEDGHELSLVSGKSTPGGGAMMSASAPSASSLLPPASICQSPRPPLEAHALVDHLCRTERGTPVRSVCRNGTLARIISRLLSRELLTGEKRSALRP
jgi:hypothetical protein